MERKNVIQEAKNNLINLIYPDISSFIDNHKTLFLRTSRDFIQGNPICI